MPRVQPEEPTGTALREELARALEIEPGSNWRELWTSAKEAVQRLANNSEVVTVLIDSLDALAASENMPLFLWEESDYPDFFAFVAALTRMARGHVRFLATGSLETARFWATDAADLEMQPILARTERLTSSELSLWLDTAHVVMSDAAAKNAIWRVTGGDWRLLNALHSWIEQTRKDQNHPFDDPIDEAEVQRFAAMIMAPELRAVQAPDLHGRVTDPALEPLRVLLRAGKELDVGEENTTDNWVAACRLYSEETRGVDWSREAWRRELQALTILREIEETQPASADGTSGRIRVAPDDPWLRLLQA